MTASPGVKAVKGLNCPNCGAAVQLRAFEHSLSAVCMQCLSVIDTRDPNLAILHQFKVKQRIIPRIPLGSRGLWKDRLYEVIGFEQRTIDVDGTHYSWYEYLLFNPYFGFRYLTEYNGHWNDVQTLRLLPAIHTSAAKPQALVRGTSFTHFSTAVAQTTYVLGEFPWRVEVGETVKAADYIAPPFLLSSEFTDIETVWSLGEYAPGAEIWKAFKAPGVPPVPIGTFANQPNPWTEKTRSLWRLFGIFGVIGLIGLLFAYAFMQDAEVFRARYMFRPGQPEASFVTPVFPLEGRPSNVELSIRTDLANNWAYFGLALIDENTGTALDFGREVSYYFGRDSDGSWTEGSAGDTVYIPSVPAGRYYLRIEPEMAPGASSMTYEINLRRDVPRASLYWVGLVLLLVPPVWVWIRRWSFERGRWQESDYASSSSGGDDDGDDE
ncbi:MAG: DUF4178 domain-containing protein [Bryobacteraceae bacterium]